MKALLLEGQRFGRLVVNADIGIVRGRRRYICICDCGATYIGSKSDLVTSRVKSCGCLRRVPKKPNLKHGMARAKIYSVWTNMRHRCLNPKDKDFHNYGARGISICKSWDNFENFHKDMGDPHFGLTLDRIDVNGNYEKSNCRWATRSEQSRNQRRRLGTRK